MHRRLPTILACLLAIAVTPPLHGALRAQGQATTDLAAESRLAPDAMVTVLDSTALRAGRGRSLVDFLAGRVPGLQVAYESGQPSAAPRIIARGSYGSFAPAEPLLYIDGVLWRDDHANFRFEEYSALPAFGWQMLVDEIEEVRVHLGAASGAMLEFGAPRGAILVTTRRPRDGAGRLRASLRASSARYQPERRTVMGRTSATSFSPAWGCTVSSAMAGQCTPDQVYSLDAHAIAPLHDRASALDVALDGTASLLGARLRLGAARSHREGTLPASALSMTTLALAAERAFGPRLVAALDARGGTSSTGVADRRLFAQMQQPLVRSPQYPDSIRHWSRLFTDEARQTSPARDGSRTTIAGRLQYRLGAATTIALRASVDQLWRGHQDSFRLADDPTSPFSQEPQRLYGRGELSTSAVGLRAERSHRFTRRVRADFLLAGQVTNTDARDYVSSQSFSGTFGWNGSYRLYVGESHARSALAAARFTVGDRLRLTGGVRHEAMRGLTIAPSLQSLSAEYLLRRAAAPGATGLTLFGGYAENVDHLTTGARMEFGRLSEPEFTIERELGLRASRGDRLTATLSHARTLVSEGLLTRYLAIIPNPVWTIEANARWRVDATVLAISMRAAPERAIPWRLGASLMRRDHVLLGMASPEYVDPVLASITMITGVGRPLDGIIARDYSFADANGDGIIVGSEVTLDAPAIQGHGGTEPRLVLTFDGELEPVGGFRIGAVAEGRFGQRAYDHWGALQCMRATCPALYDSTASLAAQAAAVAANEYGAVTGFVHDAGFVRIRELYVEAAPRFLSGARVRLSAHQLLAWTRFPGEDPEARDRLGARASHIVGDAQPIYPSVSLRIDLDY